MAKLKQVLSGKKARLEVNLDELFGTLVPNNSELRQAVGQAIIDKIRDRTSRNLDRDGKRFPNYSTEYADSIPFKAYGKSKGDPNLKQSGDMLGLMDIIDETKNKIVIGWSDGEEAGKAHGHITGNVGSTRDFLGLPEKDLNEIADEVSDLFKDSTADIDAREVLSSTAKTEAFLGGKSSVRRGARLEDILSSLFRLDPDGEG